MERRGFIVVLLWMMLAVGGGGVINEIDHLLMRSIGSIRDALKSTEKHVHELIVDSLYSLKAARDQLGMAVANLNGSSSTPLSHELSSSLVELMDFCDELILNATRDVEMKHRSDFEVVGKIIRAKWTLDVPYRNVDPDLIQTRIKDGYIFLGEKSNFCLGKLVNPPGCQVPPSCLQFNTQLGKSEYAITHQLLYFQTGLVFNCFNESSSIANLVETFCSNIFNESQSLHSLGFPAMYRDLFMEQVFLCGMSGFADFLKKDWMETIISWQDDNLGCWHSKGFRYEDFLPVAPQENSTARSHRRKKRNEKRLNDDCLCHETGMAINALVQFIRHEAHKLSLDQ